MILGADIDLQSELMPNAQKSSGQVDWNQAYFRKKGDTETKHETIALSWRVIDVPTGKTIGTSLFNLATKKAIEQYPDLELVEHDQTQLLIAASAQILEDCRSVRRQGSRPSGVTLASARFFHCSSWRRGSTEGKLGFGAAAFWQRAADFGGIVPQLIII